MIWIITLRLRIFDEVGNMFYSFIVQADTKGSAVHRLYRYLDSINFPQDDVDKVDIELLKFGGSHVVEMTQ